MEMLTVGKVVVPAKIENLSDVYLADREVVSADQVRSLEVSDALVDTGATMLSVPKQLVAQLGLKRVRSRQARTAAGTVSFAVYEAVRLTVMGRECTADVAEVPDDCPVLIGQVPLELLDFVVDPAGQRLVGNPEHGGQHMMDMFWYSAGPISDDDDDVD
jgi:clan AA aspartic protease